MTQGKAEFADAPQQPAQQTTSQSTKTQGSTAQHCDILLNNFQIKKQRYRVLLNNEHLVWEQLHGAQQPQSQASAQHKVNSKELEVESEQLSNKAKYGKASNVVSISDVIRVTKGSTKVATLRNANVISTASINPLLTSAVGNGNAATTPAAATTATAKSACKALVKAEMQNAQPTEQYLTIHYAERIVQSATDCNRWRVRSLTLYHTDAYLIRQWYVQLTRLLEGDVARLRVRRLLVFINPYGGRKRALPIYERHCKPLFQLAGIDATCIVSQHSNQIRDMLLTLDLTAFDAVCCVGGDGTVAEVINGLICRAMCDLHMDIRHPAYIPKPSLPIGIIPAGSTDTVAYSLHGTADVTTAAIHLVLGQRRGLDVCSVHNRQGLVRFCVSTLSYGYLGDVIVKSERHRWMGPKRYEYAGVHTFLANRGYVAEVSVLLTDDEADCEHVESVATTSTATIESTDSPANSNASVCTVNCQRCSSASQIFQLEVTTTSGVKNDDRVNYSTASIVSKANGKAVNAGFGCDEPDDVQSFNVDVETERFEDTATVITRNHNGNARRHEEQHSAINMSSSYSSEVTNQRGRWKSINGEFFMVCAANITCACSRSPNGIARYSHLGDGNLDVILVRKTSRMNNVRFVINTMGRDGDIRNLPFVEVYRTKQFRFRTQPTNIEEDFSINGSCQPIAPTASCDDIDTNASSWNCDGEIVTDLELTLSSHCQLLDVFMRGPYAYKKSATVEQGSVFGCCAAQD